MSDVKDQSPPGKRGNMTPTGREVFAQKYRDELLQEAAWLRAGASMKVDAIEKLLSRNRITPNVLAELGCGVGAVIEECRRRMLAASYVAVDASAEAIAELLAVDSSVDARVADIAKEGFRIPGGADLAVLSHVLEHLEEPERCLHNVLRSAEVRYAVLEVPLEGLPLGRLKVALQGLRRDTSAGHVQRYSRASFEHFVTCAGFEFVDGCIYAPVVSPEALDLLAARHRWTSRHRRLKYLTMNYLPRTVPGLWSRYYHAHYAVLVRPRRRSAQTRSAS